jgi:Mlc titration factor MtfA (ptsG expression regulator)
MFRWLRRRRRKKIRARPFPDAWRGYMERHVPYVEMLTVAERAELEGHVQVFLEEKRFEGCGGLEMTDEIRVSIAAQACMLLLGRDTDYYRGLGSILVYPSAYVATSTSSLAGGSVVESEQVRLGESWSTGQVVLSWDDVERGAADVRDGHNVVFHEFAHQLDGLNPASDGAPVLDKRSMYIAWARVLGAEYERLLDDIDRHRRTVLDSYGATNPAEFFAVASETFFEQPISLRRRHPELYDQLALFYKQDPASRYEQGRSR